MIECRRKFHLGLCVALVAHVYMVNMLPGVQVTAGLGFCSVFSSFSQVISSEDSDSPAVYGDLFPFSGVPIGIVHVIDIDVTL